MQTPVASTGTRGVRSTWFDTSMSEAALLLICLWAVRRPVGVGAAVLSACVDVQTARLQALVYKYHLLLLHCVSCLFCIVGGSQITPLPPPPKRGDGCSDVEANWEMDVATGACSSCG
jgi:hypothetical protein